LYRTSANSPIVTALTRAAENGKTGDGHDRNCARAFDEKTHITWARVLEEAGVHVVYGVVGLKTHCKASLVVRREGDAIRRYVQLVDRKLQSAHGAHLRDICFSLPRGLCR